MQQERIETAQAAVPVGAYPHARRIGPWLYLSGVGPRQPGSGTIPGLERHPDGSVAHYDFAAQCHAVMANVRAVLTAAGARWDDLIDVTVFLTNMQADFATFNRIYADYFPNPATQPCRTTVEVNALPTPIAIELKCVAYTQEAADDAATN
ncbi:MAG: RidA family protein [Candidatus Sericytochromatia bacterium]